MSLRAILIVEDDTDINDIVCELLREESYETTGATSLRAARSHLKGDAPACVVLDLNLPDGTGEDLLREMTKAGARSPCVLMSAAPDARRVAARFGVALVQKPFEIQTLLVAVAAAIERAIVPRDSDVRCA